MTGIQERLTTGKGKFTPRYPELGTGPVSYEDAISPDFFAAEHDAIFRRSWLYVGRAERLPRPGTYFTRELPGLASLVVARGLDGTVRAFHNVCAHRGNKVVWQEHPGDECSGSARQFACKYHGWRYDLEGKVAHVTSESEFFDLPRSLLAMPPAHCEELAGFVFVNLADDPVPLRDHLGDRLLELEAYPFHLMTQRYGFSTRIHGNWKLAIDSVCEWYHPPYVHGRFIDPDVSKAEKMVPPVDAYHYDLFGPHMLTSVPGPPPLPPREPGTAGPPRRDQNWVHRLFRAGLFGPDDVPDIGPRPDFLNKGRIRSWGNDQFWLFPNLSVQIWARNYYITYTYWPETVDSHIYEIDLYFVPPARASERLAQELVVDSTIEFAMQDVNTIEATHSALATRAQSTFHLSDQELMIRHFHKVVRDTVEAHRVGGAGHDGHDGQEVTLR
jgi:phenylpropionate dioxygenase-like ring-hydroxylating dioxygenase large terminal subunit